MVKSFKKAVALLIAVSMVMSLCAVNVFAADDETTYTFTAQADKTSVAPGDSVVISVYSTYVASHGMGSELMYTYDTDVFSIEAEGADWTYEYVGNKPGILQLTTMGGNVTADQPISKVKITVNENAADGVYTFTNTKADLVTSGFDWLNAEAPSFDITVKTPATYNATLNVTGGDGVLKNANGDVYPTEPTDVPADPTATTEPEATATSEPIATATNEPVTGEVTAYYLPTAGETIEEDGVVYENDGIKVSSVFAVTAADSTNYTATINGVEQKAKLAIRIGGSDLSEILTPTEEEPFSKLITKNEDDQTALVIEPVKDGTLKVWIGAAPSTKGPRKVQLWDNTAGELTVIENDITGTEGKVVENEFELTAGSQYILYGRGFTAELMGLSYTYEGVVEPEATATAPAEPEATATATAAPAVPTATATAEPEATATATAEPEATATATTDPVDPPVTGEEIFWTFGEDTSSTIPSGTAVLGNGLSFITDGKSAYAAGAECDGVTFANRIKLGGKSTFDAGKLSRVFTFTPDAAGTVTVYFVSGSSKNDGRYCQVYQNGSKIYEKLAEEEFDAEQNKYVGQPVSGTVDVAAGSEVVIGGNNNIGIYGIKYVPGATAAEVSNIKYQIAEGDTVTFEGTPAVEGSTMTITVDGVAIEGATFTMPSKDVTVDVVYTAPATPTPAPTATATAAPTEAPTTDPTQPTATPTAAPADKYTVTYKADEGVTAVKLVDKETGDEIVLTQNGTEFVGEVPVGSYTVVIETIEGKEVDIVKVDSEIKVDEDKTVEVAVIDATDVASIAITTNPTKMVYEVGEALDPTGLVITATKTDGSTEEIAYGEESGITIKPMLNGMDYQVIYGNKADILTVSYVLNEVSATVTRPVKNVDMSTVATAPEGAFYTLGEVTWSPASSTGKFAPKTVYTATVTATPIGGNTFASDVTGLINGSDATVRVNEDGTVTLTYVFPATAANTTSSGGGGGWSTGATATPAPATPAPTVEPGTQVFDDVPTTHWAYSYIMDLYNAGVVNGTSATTFEPESNVTRAEFTAMAVRVFGLKATAITTQFTDVAADAWYAEVISAALEAGIVTGVTETEFDPEAQVTREQMAAIIGRYLGTTSDAALTYTDADSIEEYAKPYVAGLSASELLNGYTDGSFQPKANATRAEAATLIDRVMNEIAETPEATATADPEATATAEPEATATAEPEATATASPEAE